MGPYQQVYPVQTGSASRSSGIYGLLRLDGGPVDRRDAATLGLHCPAQPGPALLGAVDNFEPGACNRFDQGGAITVLAGRVEQMVLLARELGLVPDAGPAQIARAALARYGAATPERLIGEWSLLHWDPSGAAPRLTIMGSAARRDPVFFAYAGARLAVAPDLFVLGRLGWVGSELHPEALLMTLGRVELREAAAGRTMYRAVSRLGPGAGKVFTLGSPPGDLRGDVLAQPPRWNGSPQEALEQAEALLLEIMRERLSRIDKSAILLSGGLDSALLAWAASAAASPPEAFTTAVPPGSDEPDEMGFAGLVAQTLHLPHRGITPPAALNSYRPAPEILAGSSGPTMSNRHCLTEAFQLAARTSGAQLLLNGTYGEAALTARLPQPGLRIALRQLAKRVLRRGERPGEPIRPVDGFHVRLAPHLLANLPGEISGILRHPSVFSPAADAEGLLGFQPVAAKALAHPNEFYPGAVRMDFPFRDLRLLRFFAALPVETANALGPDRGFARQMLHGHLPAEIVQRRRGLPADPDHHDRLQRQAPDAQSRIATFRQAGLAEWLDLDWLETELATVARHGVRSIDHANHVQLTAITAEFLLWWQSGAGAPSPGR